MSKQPKFVLIMSEDALMPSEDQISKLKQHGELEIITHEGKLSELEDLKTDDSEKIIGVDPDSFAWDMDGESVKDIPRVLAVCTQSTSFDWVKPQVLKKLGVKVAHCPGFSADSVAEFAHVMAIECARHVPMLMKNDWKVDWDYQKPMLMKGRTLGVVGLGRIGNRMAEIGDGLGMNVLYWSQTSRDKRFKLVELDELFAQADVIMLALAENKETEKLITREHLDSVKKTAVLVGINRIKQLWDQEYIIEKVQKGELRGYAFEGEEAKPMTEYQGNIVAYPPMIWYTKESLDNLLEIWVDNMIAIAQGKPQNVVNE